MKLTLNYKSVFGRDSYYPQDTMGKAIAELIPCKCFTHWQIEIMKKAGWELDVTAEIPD